MRASEAFFKGEFNEAEYRWESPESCTVILIDRRTGKIGRVKLRYSAERGFEGLLEDSEMLPLPRKPRDWWEGFSRPGTCNNLI